MCAVLQDPATGLYLEKLGAWTGRLSAAYGFRDRLTALAFAESNGLGQVNVVWYLTPG